MCSLSVVRAVAREAEKGHEMKVFYAIQRWLSNISFIKNMFRR
jgi:hypothetical protein